METIDLEYERASNGRRIAAFALDAFISLVCGAILLILTFFLLSISPVTTSLQGRRETIQENSHLFVKDDEDNYTYLAKFVANDSTRTVSEKNSLMESSLTFFYHNEKFFNNNEGDQIYREYKSKYADSDGQKLFDGSGVALYSDSAHDEAYYAFYISALDDAEGQLYRNSEYASASNQLIAVMTFSIIGTMLFPWIIFFYVIPLCMRRTRQTLGMIAVKIALIDVTGMAVKPLKLTLRFIFTYVLEVWGSLFCFLIPAGITLGMMVLTKSHQTLQDYVFNTYCVSVENKSIYKDVYEYNLSQYNMVQNKLISNKNDNSEKRE